MHFADREAERTWCGIRYNDASAFTHYLRRTDCVPCLDAVVAFTDVKRAREMAERGPRISRWPF